MSSKITYTKATGLDPIAVDIHEAQRLSGLGRSKIFALMGTGQLRSVKIGKRRLIPVAAIHELLEQFADSKAA